MERMGRCAAGAAVALAWLGHPPAAAQGHGPVYGLSTPTLGRGGRSVDTAVMGRFLDGGETLMSRTMFSYGVTEDVQLSASIPIRLKTGDAVRPVRGLTRMPMTPDVQLMLGWRFHRNAVAVGARWESTGWLAVEVPTDGERSGANTRPGAFAAAVTGYASRSWYLWAGGAHRRYLASDAGASRLGDVSMASLVVGYRPPAFRGDTPGADWRGFVELTTEWIGRDRLAGQVQDETGGRQVFASVTVLGLYGWWGVAGGPAIPLHQKSNGDALRERLRFTVNLSFWF